jgi:transglutaminase-like putative cysteine protease
MNAMTMIRLSLLCLLLAVGCPSSPVADDAPPPLPVARARFDVRHELTIQVPEGAKTLRAWFATPSPDDPAQTVSDWKVEAPVPSRLVRDAAGNQLLYLEQTAPAAGPLRVVTTFTLERREVRAPLRPSRPLTDAERAAHARELGAHEHVVIDERIRALAREVTAGEQDPLRASRRIYDWVLGHVEYWVKDPARLKASPVGSSAYALTECTGNCTDFHSLYMALSRAAGIPTRIIYGSFLKGPLDGVDQDQSYHCWLEVFAPDAGWVPLDVAVADVFVPGVAMDASNVNLLNLTVAEGYAGPDAALVEYYFGNLEPRRVTWNVGRDLTLVPPQTGGPLNALPKAHVEVDGVALAEKTGWTRKLTFRQLDGWRAHAVGRPDRPARSFHIRYEAELTDLPLDEQARVWLPLPADDAHQAVHGLQVTAPWPHRVTREPVHGNHMLYLEGPATAPSAKVVVEYDVDRWDYALDRAALEPDGADDRASFGLYLQPTTLVVADERMRELAARLTEGKTTTLQRARAFYDHVRAEMSYDKSGEGWGRGDARFACDVKRGNCTDFHAYFMALCLAAEIPARFQIGLYGDYEPKPEEYATGGYHCWAEFHVPGKGWVPVDISEADRDAGRVERLFGGHTPNRVTLSTGRDVVLEPRQAGPPLNYFLMPYVEVRGAPHAGVKKTSTWRDRG